MAYELAAAYVSVIAQTKGVGKQIQRDFGQQADAAGVSAGKTSGKKFGGAFLGVAKKAGAIGAAIAVGMAAKGGISRALNIEEAQAKLNGLGHSTTSVTKIMDNAMASVKGTAFGLGDAATVAAGVVAAGVKPGKDLERTLKLVGDGATIAGVGMSEMGAIFGKVATSNKVQGDVINQLNDAGIPIVQLLGKELGKTGEEVMAMSKAGEIGFDTFQAAMEKGLGGAALKSGETFRGSMANTGAALSRIGETVMAPFLNIMKSGMNGLIPILDGVNSALKPVMASFGAWADQNLPKVIAGISAGFAVVGATVTPIFAQIAAVAGPVFSQIGATIGPLIPQIVAFATSFSPLSLIMQAIAPLLPQIVAMFGMLGGTLAGLVAQILPLAQSLMSAIVPAFMSLVQGVLPMVITLVTTLVTAVAPLIAQLVSGLAPIIMQLATTVFPMVVTALTSIIAAIMPVVNIIMATLMPVILALIPVVTSVFQGVAKIVEAAMQIVLGVIQVVTGILTGNWSQVWEGIKNILSGVWNLIVGVVTTAINLVLGVITAIGSVIVGLWEGTWTGIKQTFEGVWNAITSFVSSAIASVAGFISGGIATVTGIWSAGWAAIGAFLSAAWAAIKSAVSTGISNVLSFFQQLPGQIGGFLSGLPAKLLSVGTDMINGLINGISNMGGAVMDAIGGVVDGAVNFAKGLLGIKSPSRVFRDQIGKMVSRGLAAGITADSKKAVDAVKKLSEKVAKAGEDGIKREVKRLQAARRKANEKIGAANKAAAKKRDAALRAADKIGDTKAKAAAKKAAQDAYKRAKKDKLPALIQADAEKQAKKNLSKQIARQKKAQSIINAQAKKTTKLWAKGAGKGTDKLLANLTKNGNWRAGTSKTVKGSTLTDIARAREVVAGRLEKANDKLGSMLDMRNDIRDAIKGELDLRAGIGEDTTNDYGYTVKGKTTFASVAGTVKALAAKAKKFAGKLKALVKKGIPSGLVQEIAGYGTDEGIKVADALLSGSGAQVKELAADYSSLNKWSTEAGKHVTEQFFGIGIDAQKGIIKGLEGDDAKLVKAAKKLTDKITKAVKKALGIKSPSRVFRDQIGRMLPAGMVLGIERGQSSVDAAVAGMVDPSVAGLTASASRGLTPATQGHSAQGGRSFSDADLAALAAMLSNRPVQAQLIVDRRQAGTLVQAGMKAEGRLK